MTTATRATATLFVAHLVLYAATASRWLAHTDSPEFVALQQLGGVAHPPGYPTVVLTLRALAWIPIDPPLLASLVTALVGATAIALLFRASVAWGFGVGASAIAATIVGLNSQVWLVHTHPEAFAFNNLFAAAILLFSAPAGPLRAIRRAVALGILAGLAIGAHHSIVLLAPIGLYGVYLATKESERIAVPLLAGAASLAAGLSVYGYLLIAPEAVSWGAIDGLGDLLDHFLRREYGTTKLGAQGESSLGEQWAFFVTESVLDFAVLGFCLGVLGAARILATDPGKEPVPLRDRPEVLFIVTWIVAGPLFIALFNVSPDGPFYEVVKRFHVLPALVMGPLIAAALQRFEDLDRRVTVSVTVSFLAVMLVFGFLRTRMYDSSIDDWIVNALESAPAEAIVVSQGDHRQFGMLYYQDVLGNRPDVTYVTAVMLGMPWYVDRLREETGLDVPMPQTLPDGRRKVDLRGVLEVFLASGRPVLVTGDTAPEILAEYQREPYGVGHRLLRDDDIGGKPSEIVRKNLEVYSKFEHRSPPPRYEVNRWGWSVYSSYFDVWRTLAERCEEANDPCVAEAREMLEKYPDL